MSRRDCLQVLERRIISPEKLRAARLKMGFRNISALCRRINLSRWAYKRLEGEDTKTGTRTLVRYPDYVGLTNLLTVLGVTYEDISDPIHHASSADAARAHKLSAD